MEIRINISEKFLQLAVNTMLVQCDDEEDEKELKEMAESYKDSVVTLDPSELGSQGRHFSLALVVVAFGKLMQDKCDKEERELVDMIRKGCKLVKYG